MQRFTAAVAACALTGMLTSLNIGGTADAAAAARQTTPRDATARQASRHKATAGHQAIATDHAAAAQARPPTDITAAAQARPPTDITAAAAELINATSGRRLWSRGLDTERPIASITKVMTAMVVIKAGQLDRKITVTQAAETYAEENSAGSAGLVPGDVLTTRQLLEGLLLPSGADAAYLLANTYGPGWRAFVRKMNATARKLGMTRTHFDNFDGLPWPTEYSTYSTPHDLMIMAKAAMKLAVFRSIVVQHRYYIEATSQHHEYNWTNTDLLLDRYRGAIGIKTGFTLGAGYCLLFEAKRGKHELLGVVLYSTNYEPGVRFSAAARLLNWGFQLVG
jgi:serine-type D-Ala-D-Ala carboxypeptidase (penicillin-binding protein 5/6)